METYEESVELTRTFVKIESTNPGTEEAAMREAILAYLKDTSCEIQLDDVGNGRKNVIATLWPENTKDESIKEKYKEVPMFIFICHMDTVVIGDGWTLPPFEAIEKDGKIYGRGACDMKSGLACCLSAFIMAARTLHASGQTPKRTLKLICSMDEEDFMRGSEACIKSGWVTSKDWVIDAEPTDGQIQMAHKGRTWYEIDVEGHTAHASTPWKGADAIAAMAEIISTLRQDILDAPSHPDMGISTVTFGQITGGYRPYVVPDHCKLWIDMRLVPPLNTTRTTQFVQNAIHLAEDKVTGIKAAYTITGDRPPIEMNPDSPLLAELKKACHHVTGHQPEVS